MQAIKNSIDTKRAWLEDLLRPAELRVQLTCLYFAKSTGFSDMVAKITTRHEIYDQVQIFPILEGIVHVDKESK